MKKRSQIQASDYLIAGDQLVIDNLFISIKDLQNQLHYEERIRYFKKRLKRCQSNIQSLELSLNKSQDSSNSIFIGLMTTDSESEINRLRKKEETLHRLIGLAEKLLYNTQDQKSKKEFGLLEAELISYLDFYEEWNIDYATVYIYTPATPNIIDELKKLRSSLRFILKKRKCQMLRDLRQSFRNIIKFLFKNMDDEFTEYNVSKMKFLNTLFNSQIFCLYVRKENNKAIICNT